MFRKVRSARKKMCTNLQEGDLYGEAVQFTFQGLSTSSSPVGMFFSCLTITMFAAFFSVRTIKFWSSYDHTFAMIDQGSEFEEINLIEHNYFFTMENIDSRAGKIIATHHSSNGEKPIDLVDCKSFCNKDG